MDRVEELARLGFNRLRDFDVPEDELDDVAEATASVQGEGQPQARVTGRDRADLFRSIYRRRAYRGQAPTVGVPPGPAMYWPPNSMQYRN